MSFIYTRAMLKTRINAGIQGKIGMLISPEDTMNEAVREVLTDLDLNSARRRATLSSGLFNGVFDYSCPSDLKRDSIIDIPAQAKRADGDFFLVPTVEFDIEKEPGSIAVDNYNGLNILKINSKIDDHTLIASELDSLTSGSSDGSSWALFGDGTNLSADTDDYVKGNGSIKWDISNAAGTTAGIQHSSINALDMTDYFGGNSSFFVWAKINSTTGLTNYILRFGTDSSNYYSKTVTTQHDGTAFVSGWNLLRFDVSSYSTTGTPTNTNIKYFAIYMTKLTSKVSETDYKFDWLVLKRGAIHYVKYYSKYGWQTSAGAYIENSTDDSDVLVADTDEFNLYIKRGRVLAAEETDMPPGKISDLRNEYKAAVADYTLKNPSEAKVITNLYYRY